MSGIAAGIRLAMFDKKVCILESHYVIGGLNSFYNMKARKFDVGLHAVTNYVPRGTKGAPLTKLFRQLRIPYEDFKLKPQNYSEVVFPNKRITFTNDPKHLEESIAKEFPHQIDQYIKLIEFILSYDNLTLDKVETQTAREFLNEVFTDQTLIEMILCPLTYYGSAIENDMELGQFVTMYKSILLEGFARPDEGVRQILKVLKKKYKEVGGELKLRNGVTKLIRKNELITEIHTEKEEILTADLIISSAGYLNTLNLIDGYEPQTPQKFTGMMSFMESISCLSKPQTDFNYDASITFFNTRENYLYEDAKDFIDPCSGVICSPGNYQLDKPIDEPVIRITNIANFKLWEDLKTNDIDKYYHQKEDSYQRSLKEVFKFKDDFTSAVTFTDIFTPHTIKRYTGHINGAVYGSPVKTKTGKTPFDNLVICGTDQGFLGIIGAILSGISISNLYGLVK
ncbi:MAG: FAD-dependent oxidoreductase [Pseudomonadales bacterium]|nr:FAD-dependent oxidoreductase [Pseudomonadales bacterium]